jgi:hypothetical protein
MPGGRRLNPSEVPFSYAKLGYYYLPCLLLIVALLISAFWGLEWLDQVGKWLPSSTPLRVMIGILIVPVGYPLFLRLLWSLLPASIRARIPYDAKEASESKGDIRSFWDLRKLVLPTHRN